MKLNRAWLFVVGCGLVAAQFMGCSDDPKTNGTTSSASASSSGNGGGGGDGGNGSGGGSSSGMPPECTMDTDCKNNGPVNFCGKPTCKMGKCIREGLKTPGTALPSQLYGDCIEKQCDTMFNIVDVAANDPYDDAKECTTDVCTDKVLSHDPVMTSTICALPNGFNGVCDGNGACVACINGGAGCTSNFTCQMNVCVKVTCTNGMKDAGEIDVDCSGPGGNAGCSPCADGKICTNPLQCVSGVCSGTVAAPGTCVAPTCMDNVKNGAETGADCGGPDCSKCPKDENCSNPNDCQSGVCRAGVCIEPKCDDAVQNGDEMGADCGGSCPTPCP